MSHTDYDYSGHGPAYARVRQADLRIAALLWAALGDARTVVNVGAGQGNYEPTDRLVIPIEPSAEMRARRASHLPPALDGVSHALPLDDGAAEAAMTVLSVHHWTDLAGGLTEMRRVASGPVVILTFDPEALDRWWLADLCPDVIAVEQRRYPSIQHLSELLGGSVTVTPVPIPADCTDGFSEAFFARPEAFLDDQVLDAQSAWGFVPRPVRTAFQEQLGKDLASGVWDRRFGHWRAVERFDGAVRILVARPSTSS